MHDLYAALCLVAVIEGAVLLAAPRGWQRMVRQASQLRPGVLRACGAVAVMAGLLVLQLVNG